MVREEKIRFVEELKERLEASYAIYLSDFTGLDVAEMMDLRKALREVSSTHIVVKNTLARRAVAASGLSDLEEFLLGPTALTLAEGDPVGPAKVLVRFRSKLERPTIKAALIDGRLLTVEEVDRLAALPPRSELLAQVVAGIQAPLHGLVTVLRANLLGLVNALDQLRRRLGEEEGQTVPTSEATPEESGEIEAADPEESTE